MKNILFLILTLISSWVFSKEGEMSFAVPSVQDSSDKTMFYAHVEPEDISYDNINKVCREFKSFHLKDTKRLDELFTKLKSTALNDQSISDLIEEINQIVARMKHDTKSEWNESVVTIYISWNIPNTYFFIAPDFSINEIENNNYFKGKKLVIGEPIKIENRYMGYPNNELFNSRDKKNFDSEYFYSREEYQLHSYLIIYVKNFTFFEICQLLETIEIDADFKVQDFLASDEKVNIKNVKFRIKKGVDNELQ